MKLSEYLHRKMGPLNPITWRARTEEQIEEWIVEWYRSEFSEIRSKKGDKKRAPPSWLANWRKK